MLILQQGIGLSVASTALHPYVQKVAATPELINSMTPPERPGCPGWSQFNIYATTEDERSTKALEDAWASLLASPSALLDKLNSGIQMPPSSPPNSSGNLCDVSIRHVATNTYPALARMPAFNPLRLGSLGPAITLSTSTSIHPETRLKPGEQYVVHVQNFPPSSGVVLEIQKAPLSALETLSNKKELVKTITSFDKGGLESIDWDAPAEEGKYILRAHLKSAPLLFAQSAVLDVTSAERRRSMF